MRPIKYHEVPIKIHHQLFDKYKQISKNDCWEFKKNNKNRYSFVNFNGTQYRSHRIAYLLRYKELNENEYICHKCDNDKCINPNHLFSGSQLDNMLDMFKKGRSNSFNKKKIKCIRGHSLNKQNTVFYKDSTNGRLKRYCKKCEKIRDKIKIEKRKAVRSAIV